MLRKTCTRGGPEPVPEVITSSLRTFVTLEYDLRQASGGRTWGDAYADSPVFRGYADYMETPEFERTVQALIDLARRYRLAYMCAEALPWRCHRWLLSDALTVRGLQVEHILTPTRRQPHRLTPGVQVHGTNLIYA